MRICGKKIPLARNGNDRGFCTRPIHSGHCSNKTCHGCGVKLTENNVTPGVWKQGAKVCRICRSIYYPNKRKYGPRNLQIPGGRFTFNRGRTCNCSGHLPKHRGRSNLFVTWQSHHWYCRVGSIIQGSISGARRHGYKSIDKMTPHSVIRKLMRVRHCVLCGERLQWRVGRGKTPHLHHDHQTGKIIGFTHPKCNPLALERRVRELEAQVEQCQKTQVLPTILKAA